MGSPGEQEYARETDLPQQGAGWHHSPAVSWVGDRFLRVSLGSEISIGTQRRVYAAYERVRQAAIPGLCDLTPAYTTLLLSFDIETLGAAESEDRVREALRDLPTDPPCSIGRRVEIPVCYDPAFGADIDGVAKLHGLSVEQVAARHCEPAYMVGYVGFTPGFAYLHGLPETLATPRLESPRTRVPAGSVGIAGTQTGIYPSQTPGGWRLIGRTPLRMFDAGREPASMLAMGDSVRFVPISRAEFDRLEGLAARGEA